MIVPTLEDYRRYARDANVVPVMREILADYDTPVSAFSKLDRGDASFLLESMEGGETWGRYSILGFRPSVAFRSHGTSVEIRRGDRIERTTVADPLNALRTLLKDSRVAPVPGLPPFSGGAVGMIGYDYVRLLEKLPSRLAEDKKHPDLHFVVPDVLLVFDNFRHRLQLVVNSRPGDAPDRAYAEAVATIDEMIARLNAPKPAPPAPAKMDGEIKFVSSVGEKAYKTAVLKAKEHIRAGDVVQVVLAHRLQAAVPVSPFDVYRALRVVNPSPYMYYLRLGELKVVGSSPEVLVRLEGDRIDLRPIAGTRPRGAAETDDRRLEEELVADPKERAEHLMLVDLGRNDVGKVAQVGSVEVPALMTVERYSHVMHLVSHVRGRLEPGRNAFDVLRACFPAGTVTGAPKVRAMEIIEELEPTRRGPYAGAVGYVSFSGNLDTCITIRTIVFSRGLATIQAGAGIVADSEPEREYEETMNKARALLRAIELAEQGLD